MKIVTLLIFIAFVTGANSQQKSIKFNSYSIEEGLSQSYATDIVQDQFGYIWIATQDGLNKYDGYEFDVLKHKLNDSKSLPNSYIHSLTINNQGLIWFGTNRGLGAIDPKSHAIIKLNRTNFPKLKGYVFSDLAFDSTDKLWALSDKHGINVIDIETKKIEIINKINGSSDFTSLFIDKRNTLWVGTKTGEIFYAAEPYKSFKEIDNSDIDVIKNINSFYENEDSLIYVTTESGVFKISKGYELSYLSKFPELKYQNISSIYQENEHKIWIGTREQGLYLLTKNKLFHYKKNPYNPYSLMDNHVNTIFADNSGCIWIATENGVSKFDKFKQGFTTTTISRNPDEGLIGYHVWSFTEDSLGNIYVGTKKALSIYHSKTNSFFHYKRNDGKKHYLLSLYVENTSKIWCGFEDGLYVLTIKSKIDYAFEKVEFKENGENEKVRVYQIVKADDNRLWIGTKTGLSILNKNDLTFDFYSHTDDGDKKSIGDGAVKVVYRDKTGKIWLVTSNQGIYNIIETSKNTFYFKHYPIKGYSETNGHITSLLQTEEGFLWLGTYGEGIKKLNLRTKETENYTEDEGLVNNVVYGLLSDEDNNIWASTNKGLSKFDTQSKKFYNYTTTDGLQSNEFNTNAYFRSSDNYLYFGGINGYTKFKSSDIKINPTKPKVIISKIITYNRDNNYLKKRVIYSNVDSLISLKLKYLENDLSFEFFSVLFSNPEKNEFKYILEGYDENYIQLQNENDVHYMNLQPGDYCFKVFGKNPDGIWSTYPTIVNIEITPPFWSTWWFRIIGLIIIGLFILFLSRKRTERIRRQKIRLELEVVKRTRKISSQNKQIKEQNKQVELQKAKIEHQKEMLQNEKDKVEGILLNVLPEGTASDLINNGKSKARYYKRVSVMFTDFVGFSKIAEDMNPQELVGELDEYFTKFDEIIGNFDLEKIKTIGDAYMCAGGVPIRNKSNAIEVVLAGLKIQDYMIVREEQAKLKGKESWKIRLGINTGELTAGVIGQKRFAYDIWGATVNQAQRMEMHGEPGELNISGNTYDIIAPYFNCTYRGKIQTKHDGIMLDMYFVNGIKPELSVDGKGRDSNKKFWKIVDLHLYSSINYIKAERHIINLLEKELSPNLHYHSINHTKDVTEAVERLALMEGITDEGLFLLKSAATYHDAGFVEQYDKNEEIGMRMAREILPKYGYSQEQIDVIDGLIKSTEIPQSPNTLLQQIMCDADLDYLGRDDFHDIASLLRRELREHGKIDSDRLWDEIQVKFLTSHTYFTKSAIDTRRTKKMKHLDEIKEKLKSYIYKD